MNVFQFYKKAISHHPWKISGLFFGDGLQAICTLLIPYALKGLVDAMEDSPQGWGDMKEPFLVFFAVVLGKEMFARVSGLCLAFLAGVFRIQPRKDMVDYMQTHSMNFFQNMHSGSLGSRINEASTGLGFSLWTMVFDIWPVIIKVFTGIILMFLSVTYLGWVTLIWFGVYAVIMMFFAVKQFYWSSKISEARSRITGKVVDMATNVYAVKSFANNDHEADIIAETGDHERRVINRFQIYRESGGIFNSIMFFGIMAYMGYFCVEGYLSQALTLGDVSFIIAMFIVLTTNMQQFVWGITHFLEYLGQTREGVNTIYQAQTVTDNNDAKAMIVKKASIAWKKVSFSYPEKPDELIFDGLDLTIPHGQKVGVVGSSGAGKSTFLNLLMRFYDIQSGEILIDGQDISKVTQESLRKNIAVIPQDTSLFHRTLMDNIRYGRLDATDAEVIEAAKQAHAHEFIAKLPDTYDTIVGERGVKLSGGQRQRIAIARAILKNAPILILDEATSALDSESERAIQDSLKHLMHNKTVIAIAHRLSTIAHLDRIIVMDDGQIVEDGTHEELLAKDRHYAMLWSMQSGGFLHTT